MKVMKMKKYLTIIISILLIFIQLPVTAFAVEYTGIGEPGTYVLNDGDVLNIGEGDMGVADTEIVVKIAGKVTVKQPLVPTWGKVTFEGITSNAELVYEGNSYDIAMISAGFGLTDITFKNLTIKGDPASSAPVISIHKITLPPISVNIGENVCIDAGGMEKWAVGSATPEYNSSITIDKSATIIGTVSEGVIDNRESGSSELTLSADLSTTPESVRVGEDVAVTGYLKPSEAAELSSASLRMRFDDDIFDLKELVPSKTLESLKVENNIISYPDGDEVTVSFNDEDSPLSVGTDGVEMFTAVFTAKKASETPAVFEITDAAGALFVDEPVIHEVKELTVAEPYPSVQVTVKYPEATCEPFGGDYFIVKYGADEMPAAGTTYFLNGQAMTYVPAYSTQEGFEGKYVFVLLTTSEPDNLIPAMAEAEAVQTIENASGDANMNNKTNIVDAQIVYYMLSGKVTSATEKIDWLNSDVDGDSVITALDYHAIQYYVHFRKFGQFS